MNRRDFLKTSLLFGSIAFIPSNSHAKRLEKRLSLYNIHTAERVDAIYWANGEYIYDEIANLEYILRDFRAHQVHPIDVSLFDYLHEIYSLVGAKKDIYIISGYRSKRTNSLLRHVSRGVAKKSYHMQGKAIDIRIPDVRLSALKYAALSLRRGGVGYYPRSNFVHIDTGTPRYWRYPKR